MPNTPDRVNLALEKTFLSLSRRVERLRYLPMTKKESDRIQEPGGFLTLVRIRRKIMIRKRKISKREEIRKSLKDLLDQNHGLYAQADVLPLIYKSLEILGNDIYFMKYDNESLETVYNRMAKRHSSLSRLLVPPLSFIYTTIFPKEEAN